MKLRVERIVPFPRDAVYAWWTDFRENDHPGGPSPATSVREILRRDGNDVWLRDRARRPAPVTVVEHVVLDPPNGYVVTARYPGADVQYGYWFEGTLGGTRILLTVDIHPRHLGRILLPLFCTWATRYAEQDTDCYLRKMTEDLSPRASSRGPLHQSTGRASGTPRDPSW